MKRLSKSRYTLFCQCPKALWLRVYKPEVAEVDDALEARFESGNIVGDLAMGLFGDFREVTTKNEDGSLDLTKMIELTRQYMDEGVENICEASFSYEQEHRVENVIKIATNEPFVKCWKESHYCAVDILRKEKGGWAIYEVKSTSFPMFNEKQTKLEKYAPDIAYQKWVLEKCGINVTGTYLVCLNSDYVREGELDLQQLFVIKDMKDLVDNEYLKVPARVRQAMKIINDETEPDFDILECCNKPYKCAFFDYCKRLHGIPTPSVFDVYGGSMKSTKEDRFFMPRKLELYRAGKMSFEDLKNEDLGHIQRLQVERKEYINKDGIRRFLDTLTYPLYFLDFETMQNPIPQYDGAKPYQQITFQYSLHIKEQEDAQYIHKAFLAPNDGSDPRRSLAEQLCKDIPMDVCTLAYNKTFECSRINELATLYPDLADHLLNISRNIKDLLDPFQAGYYYLPAMGGSFSIKSVLPALFPNDKDLDYHNLSELCQNGGDAMSIFPKLNELYKKLPKQGVQEREDGNLVMSDSLMKLSDIRALEHEIAASREALLNYCELDTWAMVKVWERLEQRVKSYPES